MKLKFLTLIILIFAFLQSIAIGQQENSVLKPRIVVLTDVSTWETDDSESLVRLFVHADLFEIEGLIYTTGWSLEETRDDFFQLIHVILNGAKGQIKLLLHIQTIRESPKRSALSMKLIFIPPPSIILPHEWIGPHTVRATETLLRFLTATLALPQYTLMQNREKKSGLTHQNHMILKMIKLTSSGG